jgi:hypothetical protein
VKVPKLKEKRINHILSNLDLFHDCNQAFYQKHNEWLDEVYIRSRLQGRKEISILDFFVIMLCDLSVGTH